MLTALLPAALADLVGAAAAVAAGLVLWVVSARLSVRPASRTAVVALYASAVLAVDLGAGPTVDGTGLLMLAAASACAVGGGAARNTLALALLAGGILTMPVAGAGTLVLLAAMALAGGLGRRLGRVGRVVAALAGFVGAATVAIVLARPQEPLALPTAVPAALSLWGILVVGVLWRRVPFLRPVGAAVLAMLACAWVPGPDADATLVVAASVALLTAVVAEDSGGVLTRRALGALAAGAVVGSTVLLTPAPTPVAIEPGVASFARPADAASPAVVARAAPAAAAIGLAPRHAAPTPPPEPAPPARPVAVAIAAIGVAGPLEDLVADPGTRELAAPADPSRAGWFAAGVVPGEQGPAVIGGHVDSRRGPGVFFRLGAVRIGDVVEVARSDGRVLRFSVIAVRRYPKDAFPTEAVYGPTSGPELRLVTCGGRFDRTVRSYDDNIVVDAVLA